jgi:hypothetical protein
MLVAAVENYNDVSRNLSYTIKNGRDIANVFEHHLSDTLFRRVKIDTLFDKMVSNRAVTDWINTLHNLRPQDYVIVFYNGHGFLNDNFDLQLTEPRTNFVSKTGTIDFNAVLEKIDLLPARQKLLIIDACYSGDIDKKNAGFLQDGKHVFESLQSLFSFSQQGNGTLVFASANGNKRSIGALESNKPNNDYFTTAFKEYFLNKDLRPDAFGRIWVNDLVRYVTVRTHALSGNDQLPNLRINNPDNNFRIR